MRNNLPKEPERCLQLASGCCTLCNSQNSSQQPKLTYAWLGVSKDPPHLQQQHREQLYARPLVCNNMPRPILTTRTLLTDIFQNLSKPLQTIDTDTCNFAFLFRWRFSKGYQKLLHRASQTLLLVTPSPKEQRCLQRFSKASAAQQIQPRFKHRQPKEVPKDPSIT